MNSWCLYTLKLYYNWFHVNVFVSCKCVKKQTGVRYWSNILNFSVIYDTNIAYSSFIYKHYSRFKIPNYIFIIISLRKLLNCSVRGLECLYLLSFVFFVCTKIFVFLCIQKCLYFCVRCQLWYRNHSTSRNTHILTWYKWWWKIQTHRGISKKTILTVVQFPKKFVDTQEDSSIKSQIRKFCFCVTCD